MRGILCSFFIVLSLSAAAQAPMGPWSNTGPIAFPTNVSGQVHGIGRISQIKFSATNPQKAFAVSASGGLFITTNGGATWAPTSGTETLPATSLSSVVVDPANEQNIYICLGDADYYNNDYGIYRTTNGGTTWAPANTSIGTRMAVEMLMQPGNSNVIVAATNNGIWKTTNGGTTWTQTLAGVFRDMKARPNSTVNALYACTATGFYVSPDFGNTWNPITNGVTTPTSNGGMRIAVSAADTSRVYLLTTGGNGRVMSSTNAGTSFTTVYNSTTQCITCYDASPTSGSQGNYNIDINANPTNANELLVIAHCVWRSTNGGATWSKRTDWYNEVHTDMHCIEWNPWNNTEKWMANDGGIWKTSDPVATFWVPWSDGLATTEIYHAAQSPVKRELISIGTQDNGELYYINGQWKTNRGGDWTARCEIDYNSTGAVYYLNQGDRRDLLPLGGDATYNQPFAGTNNARIEFVPSLANTGFLLKDTIYRSTNLNSPAPSWQMIKPLTEPVRAIASCRKDSNILYVVTNANKVYRSDNALAPAPAFTQLTAPASTATAASIATMKGNDSVVFLSCGATVWRSSNKGATWTNITGTGLSGLNIRRLIVDEASANERVFVNAGSFVHYKNNTTTAWTNHSTSAGLPSVCDATDFMIYNDSTAASILRVATYGRGVWECNINNNLPPSADFVADKTILCPGDTVHFTKTIWGPVTGFTWLFPGGNPATSTANAPAVVYTAPGVYTVSLVATNANGADTMIKTGYITVTNGQMANVQEGFQGAAFPPAGWVLQSASSASWSIAPNVGGFGLSTRSARFDNYNNDAAGKKDRMILPRLDLTSLSAARLTFDVAYAPYSTAYPDSLQVSVSQDCGQTWTTVYSKTGTTLGTAPAFTTSDFIPTASQWRKDTVNLTAFAGGPILVSFDNIGHFGQIVYVDNVNIALPPAVKFGTPDTALCAGQTVQFTDSSLNGATNWNWTFAGGNPATSNLQNPVVQYSTPGTYTVSLFASNGIGNTFVSRLNYITVAAAPQPVISANGNVLTATPQTGLTYQWFQNGNLIPGATGSTYTTVTGGIFTVTATNAAGCSGTSAAYTHTAVSTGNVSLSKGIRVYPNPTDGVFTLRGTGLGNGTLRLEVFREDGARVQTGSFAIGSGGILNERVDISALAKGIYSLRATWPGGSQSLQLILR